MVSINSWFCGEIATLKDFKDAVQDSTAVLRQWASNAMRVGTFRKSSQAASGIVSTMNESHDIESDDLGPWDNYSVPDLSLSTECDDGLSYASSVRPIWLSRQ
jgi:hypothetical protein